ncbi:LLM class flavin-dependent oxidoreductase [Actinotalea sp. K2]|uniref:LLM class flavin-dependent oxidoreductase n=1 Tax=Actinotalea sp. K2 TaxID=2939438 RepID=UPI0020170AA2|nr:LLM class flavin-dependent oxidoreductase [Actinotalea sp. K2]MCL3860528.1 LLM class flavin-dependent oxidoreductase [Actinotalea sp. K2]
MRFGMVASAGSAQQVLDMAVEAEAHGWDGFFTWDGISIGEMDTFDPWTLLGAVAVLTDRIRLGAMVFPLPRRRPWKVAREAITVDHLSGGRLVLPVGLGAVDDGGVSRVSGEASTARERAERLDEALEILVSAWSGEPFSYTGRHHTVTDLVFRPRPVQRPRIPVWVVAAWPSERSTGRAAAWDGVVPQRRGSSDPLSAAEVSDLVAWVSCRRRAGAGAPDGPYDVVLQGVLPEDDVQAVEHLHPLAEAGATWWVESRWEGPGATPEALLARIRRGPPEL